MDLILTSWHKWHASRKPMSPIRSSTSISRTHIPLLPTALHLRFPCENTFLDLRFTRVRDSSPVAGTAVLIVDLRSLFS